MIYCSTNNTLGRLGNQVMRVMSLIGLAEKFDTSWAIPKWEYAKYFKDIIEKDNLGGIKVHELNFHHDSYEKYRNLFRTRTVDLKGYFQSYKYWTKKLEFNDIFKTLISSNYKLWLEKETVAISVRRGDFVGNRNYFSLDEKYYLGALNKFNHEGMNVIIFSDDIEWCKKYLKIEKAYYCEGTDIEQLCLMSLCNNHIISQSTFSYCGAYLGDSNRVVRPLRNFAGENARQFNEKDYWIPEWVIYN